MEVSVGIKVAARGLEWDVTEVESLGPQQRVRLACTGGDLTGLEWDILHPAESLSILRTDPSPEEAGPLSDWRRYHIARLLEQIPGAPVPPGRVAIEAYQRVPLLRALDMVRPRLLLADGVGLGKTIQAGLIAAELLVRRRAHRILIVCPPGPLLRQWEQEMRIRFGLRFTPIADTTTLREARRGLEIGNNPFDATALCLTSMDFAKQDRVLSELERVAWDLVIIDEAHHSVGEENQRRRLAEVLATKSDGLLLLTATPHDGHDPHFASLIALLAPSLVDGAGKLVGTTYRRHVVRRLKSHIRTPSGAPLFRERIVIPIRVDVTDIESVQSFHKALSALVAPRLQKSSDRNGLTDALAFVSLLKRSMSTIAACLATLRVVADRYGTAPQKERRRALQAYRRRIARFGVLATAEEAEIAELEAEEMAANLQGTADDLHQLIRLGEAAAPHDPKLAALVLEIRLIRLRHPNANILVYTEYADSQHAALQALSDIGGAVLTISGADSEADRTRAAERCAEEDGIILISTDSLAEGLNLHRRCFHLIHLDLPYNPNRLEQRNGRIDRYGQRNDPEIRYLFLAGTFEERLLLHLIAKYEKARSCLAFMPNTLAVGADPASLREPLFAGFAEDLFSALPRLVHSLDLAAEDTSSDAYRDLLREIDRAFQSFDHMAVRHGWLSGGETQESSSPESHTGIDLAAFVKSVLIPTRASYPLPANCSHPLPTNAPHPSPTDAPHPSWPGAVPAIHPGTVGAQMTGTTRQDGRHPGRSSTSPIDTVPEPIGYRVPPAWAQDLDDLPGFNRTTGIVYLTEDPDQTHDAAGRPLIYPGRSHPLTRRAIAAVRTGRVSAAKGHALSLQVTYVVEAGPLLRTIFVLRLFPDGTITEQPDILSLAQGNEPPRNPWRKTFASWAPSAMEAATPRALEIADQISAAAAIAHQARLDRQAATTQTWLARRANELCGPPHPTKTDLFATEPQTQDWRSNPAPADRLANFAADPSVPTPQRRDAAEALARLHPKPQPFPQPTTRRLGLLMLVP